MQWDWFTQGGPVMYPLLVCSLLSVAVTLERGLFWLRWRGCRDPKAIETLSREASAGRTASYAGEDPVAALCAAAIRDTTDLTGSLATRGGALVRSMRRFLRVHDTIVTLAPMLGILGTVMGIIDSFQVIGSGPVAAPEDVTGGVAEALLTTACGLVIAMLSLVPYNYFMGRAEEATAEVEEALSRFEHAWSRGHAPGAETSPRLSLAAAEPVP